MQVISLQTCLEPNICSPDFQHILHFKDFFFNVWMIIRPAATLDWALLYSFHQSAGWKSESWSSRRNSTPSINGTTRWGSEVMVVEEEEEEEEEGWGNGTLTTLTADAHRWSITTWSTWRGSRCSSSATPRSRAPSAESGGETEPESILGMMSDRMSFRSADPCCLV